MAKSKKINGNDKKGKKGFGKTVTNTVKRNTDDLRNGRAISIEFFKRNAWLIIAIITALIGVMGLRYRTKTRMSEIKTLNKELQRAESEKLHEKAWYMTLIRETELTRLTTEKHLGLKYQEEPPVVVECEGLNAIQK
ncbi:MAG: hypothetical protein K2K25_04655 [Muribaculaceae bacterium]|nr:hypothetical protein [Muribaculaceae bacterium]MDE6696148.1 hypothetical protein [Muribaculaceae bacterium]